MDVASSENLSAVKQAKIEGNYIPSRRKIIWIIQQTKESPRREGLCLL